MGLINKTTARFLWASTAIALLSAGAASQSLAADLPAKAVSGGGSAPAPMAVGGWLFSPTLFAGAVYNSNVNQADANKVSSWGERIVPGFTASLSNGIHQTSIYGIADLANYSNSGATHKTTVDAKVGVTQTYFATRDLTFRLNSDFTRQADVFGASNFAPANTPINPTSSAPIAPITVAPQSNPVRYNQYSTALTGDKRFGRFFMSLSGSAVRTQFDSNSLFTTSRDGSVYTVAERTGFDLTPQLYAFVDPQYHWQRFSDSTRNSKGYRVTGGVGTSAPGLWTGEVFGGYQSEKNDVVGTYSGAVAGVRVGYSPTPMWDFRASVDEALGASSIDNTGAAGVGSKVTTALLSAAYRGLPPGWSTTARAGFVRSTLVNSSRDDKAWLAGANVGYEIWRNLGLMLDYQYKTVNSNFVGQGFNQHMVSLGLSYKY